MTVLIVDDDGGTRQLLARVLLRDYPGATVLEADDGLSALKALLSEHVDFVLLDLTMNGLGGLDTLEAIRRSPTHARLPVVVLSGQADPSRVLRAQQLGVEAFLAKPFSIKVLRQRLYPLIDATLGQAASPLDPSTSDRVLIVDSQPGFRGLFRECVSVLCHVDEVSDELSAFTTCVENLPLAIFVGVTAEPFDTARFTEHLRRVIPHARPRVIAMLPAEQVESGRASGLYHAVVTRSYSRDTLERGVFGVLSRSCQAKVLFSNVARVAALLESAASILAKHLAETTVIEELQEFPDPSTRSVWAGIELQSAQLGWELRMRAPVPAMLAVSGGWSDMTTDEVTEVRMLDVAGAFAVQLAQSLRADLLARGLDTDIGAPRSSLGRGSRLWPFESDRSSAGGWIVSPRHRPAMVVQLVPLGVRAVKV